MVIGGLILALALPITIILTQQQQDLRQRAASGSITTPPSIISVTEGSNCRNLIVRWTQASPRSAIAIQTVHYVKEGQNPIKNINIQAIDQTSYAANGLEQGAIYIFQVSATDKSGKQLTSTSYTSEVVCGSSENGEKDNGDTGGNTNQCGRAGEKPPAGFGCCGARYSIHPATGLCTLSDNPLPTPTTAPSGGWNSCSSNSANRPGGCTCKLGGIPVPYLCASNKCEDGICTSPERPTPTPTQPPINSTPTSIQSSPISTPTPIPTKTAPSITQKPKSSSTPMPTVTSQPTTAGGTRISLSLALPGIGSNTAASGSGTLNNTENPVRTTRQVEVRVESATGTDVTNLATGNQNPAIGTLTFDPTTFTYKGTVNLGSLPTANYLVLVRLDNTLYSEIPGFPLITTNSTTELSQIVLISGDIDRTGNSNDILDLADYNLFIACYKDEAICTDDAKTRADLNENGKIDTIDLTAMQRGFANRQGATQR